MLESGEAKTGLGSDLSEDSGLFENPICRWRSCMSCCCERDNSFVPPPGSLSASGKADWPILGNRRKVGGGRRLMRWRDGWKDWWGGAENLASGTEQCHTAMIHVLVVGRQYSVHRLVVAVEAVVVSTCMLLTCMHVCVCGCQLERSCLLWDVLWQLWTNILK